MTNQAVDQAGGTRRVVTDAGPLIHLDELECLGLLADFAEVRIPEAVWREVEHHRPRVLQSTNIPLVRCLPSASARVDALTTLYTLHAGEREALCLCLEFSGAMLLTDDTAARVAFGPVVYGPALGRPGSWRGPRWHKLPDAPEGLQGERAGRRCMEVEAFSTGMHQTAELDHAAREQGFVARVVIDHHAGRLQSSGALAIP